MLLYVSECRLTVFILLPYDVGRKWQATQISAGCRIPFVTEARIEKERPIFSVILSWNIKEEVMMQLAYVREWDGGFVTMDFEPLGSAHCNRFC